MSTARLLGRPSNMVMHKSCIYPSTWLCRRGTGKVFPWRKAARGLNLNFTVCGFMTLGRSLTYTEPQFPHLKNEESRSPAGVVRITGDHACEATWHKGWCTASLWSKIYWALAIWQALCLTFTFTVSLALLCPSDMGIPISILQQRRLKIREVKWPAQRQGTREGWN